VTVEDTMDRSLSLLDRVSRWFKGPPTITISVNDTRFINNLSVAYDPLRIPFDFPWINSIYLALNDCGYLTMTQREIAEHYCPNSDELDDSFKQLEAIQIQKENRIAVQDFEGAAHLRDQEEMKRMQIDKFVRDTIQLASANEKDG